MKNLLLYILLTFSLTVSAQEKDKTLPDANEEYKQNKFVDAEANYRISQSKFPKKSISSYNLGNSIYKQNQVSEAKFAYAKAIKNAKTKTDKHKAFHNLGNVFMKEKDYTQAVEAYKQALRNDPTDDETRYNYAYAKQKLKENPPKNDKNKDKNKDKDKDKKDDKKDGDKKDKKDGKDDQKKDDKGDKDKDKKDGKGDPKKDDPSNNGEPKPMPGGISKERVQNLLDAVNNEEKKIQDKVNAQKVKGTPRKTEKDW
ncbi:tetratricopeptide repeat protein [Flavobacterium sp. Fl-77]|uniref:Tetratricopeptide repeat protein n=1 Tax=Flavobacterium flavipigmentatum TaxID=2893884 RepID=A0AAJ2VVQ2_9FLAO|nr:MULTISPECIES: tetratricopeptide repeat protein [unclassified Flavobacterium]MDX6180733.1 tetratricopeptide repeat protein [Flavobacterium sp. Fl-33]MDX6184333.1 tetratricopeptide repeat protein [Flavobacterium sp. Fl-77]UFH39443.1 tetratricopeptide repeat protein [Flavobacterium sp. F-70]